MGKIILVPSPIGNLEDITLRALRTLKESDLILCEDTRTSGKLLQHYEISKPLKSFHIHNEHQFVEQIIHKIQTENLLCTVLTDAGTPGISDPGFLLVRKAIETGVEIECLPGPTALIPALVISGLPSHEFRFMGFLPPKKGRKTKLEKIAEHNITTILYESPHKIATLLKEIREIIGEQCLVSLSRELSKMFEETIRGTITEVIDFIGERKLKGEIVVTLHPNKDYEIT